MGKSGFTVVAGMLGLYAAALSGQPPTVTTPRQAIFVLANGTTVVGTLEKLGQDSATCIVNGRRYTYPARFFASIETKTALYTLDKAWKFHHDLSKYAKEGAGYEINLRCTVALAKPLEFYEVRGLVKRILPDQSVVLVAEGKAKGSSKTVMLPPGSVRALYLGHEAEYDLREFNPNTPPKNHVLRLLYWADESAGRRRLYKPPARFQAVSWLLNSNQPGPFGGPAIRGTRTGFSKGVFEPGGFDEVLAEWKRSGDAKALGIPYTWNPKWAEEKQALSQLGVIGRAVNGWKSLPPEHREAIKQLVGTTLDIAGKIAAQAEPGVTIAPPEKTGRNPGTAPKPGIAMVTITGRVIPKSDAVCWDYENNVVPLGGLAKMTGNGSFTIRCERNRPIWIWAKESGPLVGGREGKRKRFVFDKDTRNVVIKR